MGIDNLIDTVTKLLVDKFIPLAFALCLLYFFWGIAKYIRSDAGSEKAVEQGRKTMVWGVLALFVVFSIWGIIAFIRDEFQIRVINNVSKDGFGADSRIMFDQQQ